MVSPTSCACGKVHVLLHDFQSKKLCNKCYKEAKKTAKEANLKKDQDAHSEAVAKKAKAASEAAAKTEAPAAEPPK